MIDDPDTYFDKAGKPITRAEYRQLKYARYLDRNGQPMRAFADRFEDADYKRVAYERVGDAEISTVWLGINHNFDPDGPPLIFETMIFGGPIDQSQWRYSTLAEAKAGHTHAVELVRMAET